MSVCKFYLENRCRYGENCRFEHPRGGAQRNLFGSGGGGGGTSWKPNSNQKVTFRDSFGATSGNQVGNNQFKWVANQNQGAQATTQPPSAVDLVNALPKEMEMWEKTKMWPFSCLSVEKDAPSLPDFVDTSVEELRLEYYEAQKTGTIAAYSQRFQNLVMEFQNKRMQLKHMNMDVKQKLVSFIEQARKNKANQNASTMSSSNPFGQSGAGSTSQATGIFGQTSGGSLFGKPSGSTFGSPSATTQTSLFGKPQGSSALFSSSQTSQGQGSIFGGSKTSGSLFGGQSMSTDQNQSSSGLFGNSQSPQQTSGLFGGSSAPSQTGLFGKPVASGSSNPFGSMASTSSGMSSGLFSNSPGPTPGVFGQSPPAGLFGTPANPSQPQNGLFGNSLSAASPGGGLLPTPSSSSGTGLFGKNIPPSSGLLPTPSSGLLGKGPSFSDSTSASGLFGKGLTSDGSSGTGLFGKGLFSDNSQATGLFGKGPAASGSTTAPDPGVNKGRHSRMEDLTEQDIEAFKASSFTLGKIPIKPPPKELVMI